ncbi:piggyBac transposable element-derived protein 4-like [Macrobrachium rosenbergii]|uniref:piggyBac transposable element-derived protein 4-like n=1 Tax=Macrobrachium rosenbergii TaxID=79674 RepID=UPI0034D43482
MRTPRLRVDIRLVVAGVEIEQNCKKNYTPSEFVTIGEMLVAFRGHCPFRQYIPSKPAKYGIKIHALCDAKTFYVCNMEIYAGTQPDGLFKADKQYNSSQAVVTRLISDTSGSARNVTFDNWYTSYPLVESLLRDHNLTTVGTLRKNKREIPPEFLVTKNRPLVDSMFGFGDNLTLVSFIPKSKKKKKHVVLVSSMHHDAKIDEATGDDKKPEIITFYNSTKGVDVVDMMMDKYSVPRNSRRWPLTVFFVLLNIVCVNSYVLYAHNPQNKLKRRKFIKKVCMMLLEDTLKRRLQNIRLPKSLRTEIGRLFPKAAEAITSSNSQTLQCQAKRCVFCTRSKDQKDTWGDASRWSRHLEDDTSWAMVTIHARHRGPYHRQMP